MHNKVHIAGRGSVVRHQRILSTTFSSIDGIEKF